MAILATSATQIARFADALFDVKVGSVTMAQVQADIGFAGGIDNVFNSYYDAAFGMMSTTDVASMMVANLGITTAAGLSAAAVSDAEAYVEAQLNSAAASDRGAVVADILNMFSGLTGDATYGAAASAWNSDIADAQEYAKNYAEDVSSGYVVTDFSLTSATDHIMGSDQDDKIDASITQNSSWGGVSNTLSSADKIDGGDGVDTLHAELTREFVGGWTEIDIQPETSNVEIIQIEARDGVGGRNYYDGDGEDIVVDAKHMTDVDVIGSHFSDSDLKIENLTTLTSNGEIRLTSDMTVVMDHTDNFNSDEDASDLTVYFDEDYLNTSTETEFQPIVYWLLDEDAAYDNEVADDWDGDNDIYAPTASPLRNIDKDGIIFTVDGGAPVSLFVLHFDNATVNNWDDFADGLKDSVDVLQNNSYDPLSADADVAWLSNKYSSEAQWNAAVAATADLQISVEATPSDDTTNDNNQTIDIYGIVVNDPDSLLEAVGYTDTGDNTQEYDVYGRFDSRDPETSDLPISINVELEKVGRDGEGGNLIIGAKDQNINGDSDEDQNDGIDVFNVYVRGNDDQPSNLGYMTSTDQALDTVNIMDHADWDGASLTLRNAFNGQASNHTNATNMETVNANGFSGDLNIGIGPSGREMMNVDTFTATGGGDVSVEHVIDGAEKGNFSMTTGAGNDALQVILDGDAVDTTGTSLSIETGSGNDQVTVFAGTDALTDAGVSHNTTEDLDNLSISTSSGADMITLVGGSDDGAVNNTGNPDGDANFNISAGANSDTVYINSISDFDSPDADTGEWLIGTESEPQTWVERVLYEATLTVNFAGFEETVDINTTASGNFIADQMTINEAIIDAISSNSELSRLLDWDLDTASQELEIMSVHEGLNDLTINVVQPTLVAADITTSHESALRDGLIQTIDFSADPTADDSDFVENLTEIATAINNEALVNDAGQLASGDGVLESDGSVSAAEFFLDSDDDDVPDTDGTDETEVTNYSVIDMGTGANDLVILNSDIESVNTLDFTAAWGKVSVLNFFEDAQQNNDADGVVNHTDAITGNHVLDFTMWLDDTIDDSGNLTSNSDSAERIATTLDGGPAQATVTDFTANEVVILNAWTSAVGESWSGMTAADVDSAITTGGASSYGSLGAATATLTAAGTLNGSTQDSILMIENDLNQGEYKVFNVEASDISGADDFAVTYLGIIDFGESLDTNFTDANLA